MRPMVRRLMLLACLVPALAFAQDLHLQGRFQPIRAPAADARAPSGEVRATVAADGDVRIDLVASGLVERVTSATLHTGDGGGSTAQVARIDVAMDGSEARVIGARVQLTLIIAAQVRDGGAYLVLHSSEHPDGYLRAQLAPQPRSLGTSDYAP